MAEEMGVTRRSELLNQDYYFAGCCFLKHPLDKRLFVQVSLYRGSDSWVLCLSEGRGKGSPNSAKAGLGSVVPGEHVAPFAQRQLKSTGEATEFEAIKGILQSSFALRAKHSGWQWANAVWEVNRD